MKIDVSTASGYNIACALRGPDDGNLFKVKEFTTSVIRYFVGVQNGFRGPVVLPPADVQYQFSNLSNANRNLIREGYKNSGHFREHFGAAMTSLIKRGVPGAKDYYKWFQENIV